MSRFQSRCRLALALLAVAALGACASTSAPVVYPVSDAGRAERAQADLLSCRAEADSAVGTNGLKGAQAATTAGRRGAVEFVDKAVESVVNGSREVWAKARGAGAGALAGSLTSVALQWNEPDSVYRNYVDHCLRERGHRVLGWR